MFVGVLLALLTSLSWACGNVFVQKSGRAVGTVRATLWSLLIGAALAGLLSLFLDEPRAPVTPVVVAWTALASVAGLTAYLCLFYTFSHGELSLTAPLITSWSLIASLLSMVVFGERLGPVPLTGAAVVFVGVLLVAVGTSRKHGLAPARGKAELLIAFGAALGFGVMIPALTHVTPALGELGATAAVYLGEIALGLPIALGRRIDLRPPRGAWALVVVTGCAETAGFVSVSFARRFAPLTVVTPVSSLAAALTVLYAWMVLRERPRPLAAAGAVLASIGIVVLAR